MEKQATIRSEVSVSGKGLHSGKFVTVTFKPAAINCGITFRRIDLPNSPLVKADVFNVYDTSRGTAIQENNAEVKTIEHLMASLHGLKIDNVMIDIDGEEVPILDGSSKLFVAALTKAGRMEQDAEKKYIEILDTIRFSKPDKGIELAIEPADSFSAFIDVDYNSEVLPAQSAELHAIEDFVSELSPCRTFVFLHEIQFLIDNNLVKGGDLENAIVFVEKMPDAETLNRLAKFFNKPDIHVMENGVLNTLKLQFPNEPARHKLLDLVGDLYLLGASVKGKVTAKKTGHFANVEFGKLIAESYR
ncbi:MAG: UDP-3-O-acyl-N-acetylglucosamine deacetylase [Bacteroidales bacterium]|nr:UDP-3-O-acyl-N-acetylglucosamine deacetylase [Bacteroidales bacterium]